MQNKNNSLIFCILFFLLFFIFFAIPVLYLTLNPLYFKSLLQIVKPRRIPNIEYARNYYIVISSICTIIIGLSGIALGYFYYFHKKKNDDDVRKREQTRKRLENFMSRLDSYDEQTRMIFKGLFKDNNELSLIKENRERNWEYMELILDLNYTQLGFEKEDTLEFIKLNSYVEKHLNLIHFLPPNTTLSPIQFNVPDEYIQLIHNAQQRCHERVA